MPHKRPQELHRAARHRAQWRDVAHIPGLPPFAQQEVSYLEIRTDSDWARTGLWPGAVREALLGWTQTSHRPAQRHFHPCHCCGRSSRTILAEALALLSAPSARELDRLLAPLDARFRSLTLPNPLSPSDLPWWERRP